MVVSDNVPNSKLAGNHFRDHFFKDLICGKSSIQFKKQELHKGLEILKNLHYPTIYYHTDSGWLLTCPFPLASPSTSTLFITASQLVLFCTLKCNVNIAKIVWICAVALLWWGPVIQSSLCIVCESEREVESCVCVWDLWACAKLRCMQVAVLKWLF